MTDIKMTTLLTTENPFVGDIFITPEGQMDLVSGREYVAQSLTVRLNFFKTEWYLDEREGIPYIQTLFQKGISDAAIRSIFRSAILTAPGVVALRRFSAEIDRQNRSLSVSFSVDTTEGSFVDFPELIIEV